MQRYLMDFCLNYRKEACDARVKTARLPKENPEGKPFDIWPCGEEQKELDEICEKCESRYFKIYKKECLVCGSEEFQKEVAGIKITGEKNVLKNEISFMECARCGSKLQYIIAH